MARKSKETALVVGVIGTGAVTGRPGIEALTEQFVEANGPVIFVVPFSDEFFTDSIAALADWALENEVPVRGIVHPSYDLDESWLADLDGPPHETALVRKELQKTLIEADESALIVLWDDEDKECQAACLALDSEGIPLYEMSSGLAEIEALELGDPDDAQDSNTQPEKEPAVAKKEAPEEEPEEFEPYTREELEQIAEEDRDQLKVIASEDFELDIAPRMRSNTIIDAILKAQEELDGDEEAEGDDEPEEADVVSESPEGFDQEALIEAIVEETAGLLTDLVAPIVADLESLHEKVDGLQTKVESEPKEEKAEKPSRPARRRPRR